MEYSVFRDDKLDNYKRMLIFVEDSVGVISSSYLRTLTAIFQNEKANFKFLVENFHKMNEKDFICVYRFYYQWNCKNLFSKITPTEEVRFLMEVKPKDINYNSLDSSKKSKKRGFYQKPPYNDEILEYFKLIKSEFTKEILENDYKKYCERYDIVMKKISTALKNKKKDNQDMSEDVMSQT